MPGADVSPGARTWSLANAPAFTVIAGLPLPVIETCVTSEAVTVALPAVLSVTLKLLVPPTNAALAAKLAFASLELMATVSLVFTTFQLASTALTVTLNAVPAVWARGVPVLPLAVPGAAVSPGTSNCSLANAPELTTTLLEVALLRPALVKTMLMVSAMG